MPLLEIPGRYQATVTEAKIGESAKGTAFIQLNFETDDNNHISGWLYLSDAAIDRTFETLEEAFEFSGNFESIETELRGKACSIVCEEEDDQKGKPRMRVKWINKVGAGVKPVADEDAWRKGMSSRYLTRKDLDKACETAGVRIVNDTRVPATTPDIPEDDDVPF